MLFNRQKKTKVSLLPLSDVRGVKYGLLRQRLGENNDFFSSLFFNFLIV